MRRGKFSTYVAFSLDKDEHARMARLARRFGYATLDALSADLFRIGLASVDTCFVTTTHYERFLRARSRLGGRHDATNDPGRRGARP